MNAFVCLEPTSFKTRRVQYNIYIYLCVWTHFTKLIMAMLRMSKHFDLRNTPSGKRNRRSPWIPVVLHASNSFSQLQDGSENSHPEKQMRPWLWQVLTECHCLSSSVLKQKAKGAIGAEVFKLWHWDRYMSGPWKYVHISTFILKFLSHIYSTYSRH